MSDSRRRYYAVKTKLGQLLPELWAEWEQEGRLFWQEMDGLVEMLDELIAE